MALTKTAIKALVAAATKVIQAKYPKAKGFDFDGDELRFTYFDKEEKSSWDDGMVEESIDVPVGDMDESFPECCGYSVLTNFKAEPTPLQKAAFTLAFHGNTDTTGRDVDAALFATTANQPGADAMLLANGFELIHAGINPRSGNLLRAYIYKITTPRSRRKS